MSWVMFGFCMARIWTCILRIVWATRLTNVHIAIAAEIFTNVGVLCAYIVAMLLAHRMLRATQPRLGWNKLLTKMMNVLYTLLCFCLIIVIIFTVLSFYTLNMHVKTAALWIQRSALLYMLIYNIISLIMQLLSLLLPSSPEKENFGKGSLKSKQIVLGVTIFFCLFIVGYRFGTTWTAARLESDPAWYDSKAAFYVIDFSFEIIIIYMLLFTRFDRMFWVPDGSKQPGDYSRTNDPDTILELEGRGKDQSPSEEASFQTGDPANVYEQVQS